MDSDVITFGAKTEQKENERYTLFTLYCTEYFEFLI